MGNPVVRFEVGAAEHGRLVEFYGELFGWGMETIADGYTLIDTPGRGRAHRGGRAEQHRGPVGDLLCGGG
jgi:predicted enzyme related to lactoylglutathione lyase